MFLYKLHGSLDWKKHIELGFIRTGIESKIKDDTIIDNLIIAPTLSPKDGHEIEPFKAILKNFEDYMNTAEICLVIGFSFRDIHIKRIFQSFVKSGKSIVIVSPDAIRDFYEHLFDMPIPEHLRNKNEIFISLTNLDGTRISVHLITNPVSIENIDDIVQSAARFLHIQDNQAWYSNDSQRSDMIDRFFCILWREDRNNIEVVNHGMKPSDVWEKMGMTGFGKRTEKIIDDLMKNNIEKQRIMIEDVNIKVTEKGKKWGDMHCNRIL